MGGKEKEVPKEATVPQLTAAMVEVRFNVRLNLIAGRMKDAIDSDFSAFRELYKENAKGNAGSDKNAQDKAAERAYKNTVDSFCTDHPDSVLAKYFQTGGSFTTRTRFSADGEMSGEIPQGEIAPVKRQFDAAVADLKRSVTVEENNVRKTYPAIFDSATLWAAAQPRAEGIIHFQKFWRPLGNDFSGAIQQGVVDAIIPMINRTLSPTDLPRNAPVDAAQPIPGLFLERSIYGPDGTFLPERSGGVPKIYLTHKSD